MDLIVSDKNGIVVQRLYNGTKGKNMMCSSKVLNYGDIFTISNQGKYISGIGWFISIIVNEQGRDYVRTIELEEALDSNRVQSIIDLMLDFFILSQQIDKSLELRNKELFLSLSKKQKESSYLFDMISSKLLMQTK